MTKTILVTFGGREDRMDILRRYMLAALDRRLIDEWHVWDFARSASDRDYLERNYGEIQYLEPDSGYRRHRRFEPHRPIPIKIQHDLHIALRRDGDPHFFEIVAGGWDNAGSAIRVVPNDLFESQDRPANCQIFAERTPSIVWCGGLDNIIEVVNGANGETAVMVNGHSFLLPITFSEIGQYSLYLRGGWGASLEFADIDSRIKLFVGNRNENIPFFRAYRYYAERYDRYENCTFLKCDDDIVYVDLENLRDFIDFRNDHPEYFIVSANVVNNGVCAYHQYANGSLADDLGAFERPPGGLEGSLWASGAKAQQLHQYFLSTHASHLPLAAPVIDWTDRNSINFIAWRGEDLKHMRIHHCDDEDALSVSIPKYLGRKTAIYSNFMVAHLSFGVQDKAMDIEGIIDCYRILADMKL